MRLPRRPEAVVFDMDGLLFDTEALHFRCALDAAEECALRFDLAAFCELVGTPAAVTQAKLDARFGAEPAMRFRMAWRRNFAVLAESGIPLKPGVIELLDTLDALPMPFAIATSSAHEAVTHHLGLHGLGPRFAHRVAAGDYARGKPNPDPFLTAAARLGVAPVACLALEDSHNGVRAAAAAGMMTVMVPDMLDASPEMRGLALHVARDLHEVRAMVLDVAR